VPGAILGSLALGLTESYGVALFGATYRDIFAFVLLIGVLMFRPNGLFGRGAVRAEPLTGTFLAPSRPVHVPALVVWALAAAAVPLPLIYPQPYLLQTLTNAWLSGFLTLMAGTAGQISLGHAALLAIGAYASALLALNCGIPVIAAIPLAGVLTAALGTLLIFPVFRLRGHFLAIATLAIGQADVLAAVSL
jgi:branched-chain amino acid transport system permease protein